MGAKGSRVLVLAARQPEFVSLLEDAGYAVETSNRPLNGADAEVDVDVAVIFRGRLIGRGQAPSLSQRGVQVIEVLTVDPPGASRAGWLRVSNRIPKSDLVQLVHAAADLARARVGADAA
ncbi:MAG: hypothetical protein ACRDON_11340 [Gaiellaceae bacterium]